MIYFIQQGEDGPIKIGFAKSRASVAARLRTFQTGHSVTLRLLGMLPGDRRLEASLHERFGAVRVRGEWFEPTDAVLRMVRRGQVAASTGDLSAAMARWAEHGFLADDGSVTAAGCIFFLTMEDFAREAGADPDHPHGTELIHEWADGLADV